MALYSFSNGFLYLDVATTQQTPSGSVVILDGYSHAADSCKVEENKTGLTIVNLSFSPVADHIVDSILPESWILGLDRTH